MFSENIVNKITAGIILGRYLLYVFLNSVILLLRTPVQHVLSGAFAIHTRIRHIPFASRTPFNMYYTYLYYLYVLHVSTGLIY